MAPEKPQHLDGFVSNAEETKSAQYPSPPSRDSGAATKGLADAVNAQTLLRRLSLVNDTRPSGDLPHTGPTILHPGAKCSGRVISAVFCVPHSISYGEDGKWKLDARRGTSALFDSLSYLSSDASDWDHTVVGWTGEITQADNRGVNTPGTHVTAYTQKRHASSHDQGRCLSIPKDARGRLEDQLSNSAYGKVMPVWLTDDCNLADQALSLKDQSRWRQYAERELYTLFHYKQRDPTGGRTERMWWADYHLLNKLFADRIMEIYRPGDIILVHDYQLLLLPAILRQRVADAYIGFFLHVPFPSSEFLRCLSRRKEVLQGMLGANLVGFQSYGYSRHFVSCCKRILHFESSPAGIDAYGSHVAIDVFPIGIHASATREMAYDDPAVEAKMRSIREQYGNKKIIVGRDRLDTVRGVAQKLQAFEIFLDWYPEWQDKVVLIQVTSPTSVEQEREDDTHKIANKVADLVSRINGSFGSLSFSPVHHYSQYISRDEYFALLRLADVGLITSVRDGMNTTSLEYVVCQEGNYSPLILSEFSGTAGSLSHALHINPWDLGGVAKCIDQALNMPKIERQAIHKKLHLHVTTNTIQAWTNSFLSRLMNVVSSFGQVDVTPSLDKALLLSQFRKAKKRLFMFDYDGTLTPIVKDPQAAIPSDRVIRTLKTLAADPRNAVWIISGRDQAFLDEWMGHIPELGLSAEHGCFLRHPMDDKWENVTEKTDMSWQEDVMDTFQHFTEKTQGAFIERKKVALTWHYRAADPEYGAYQAAECRKQLEQNVVPKYEVEVMAGKANLEVRPRFVNKGEIAKRLIKDHSEAVEEEAVEETGPDADADADTKPNGHVPQLDQHQEDGDKPPTKPPLLADAVTPSIEMTPGVALPEPNLHPTPNDPTKPSANAAADLDDETPAGHPLHSASTSQHPPTHLTIHNRPDFVFCLGDDFTDEDMFRALSASDLPKEHVFTVTIGASSKVTAASWHLLEPSDVLGCLGMLVGSPGEAEVGAIRALEGEGVGGGPRGER